MSNSGSEVEVHVLDDGHDNTTATSKQEQGRARGGAQTG